MQFANQNNAKPAGQQQSRPKSQPKGQPAPPASQVQHVQGATLQNNTPLGKADQWQDVNIGQKMRGEAGAFELLGQRFTDLQDLHDWLDATKPTDPVLTIQCTPNSVIDVRRACRWHYYQRDQKIAFVGNGAIVNGLHDGKPTPGFFLAYRPAVGPNAVLDSALEQLRVLREDKKLGDDHPDVQKARATVAEAQAGASMPANLSMTGLTVRGFESGGVEVSPVTAAPPKPAAEGAAQPGGAGASPSPSAEANYWDGGIRAFVHGASFTGMNFADLGNQGTDASERVWENMRFGAGGVVLRGVRGSTVDNCGFQDMDNANHLRSVKLEWDDKTGAKQLLHLADTFGIAVPPKVRDKGDAAALRRVLAQSGRRGESKQVSEDGSHLIHAVYLHNGSSENTISNNRVSGLGGDPFRVSNGSNNNVFDGNRARNSGQHSLVNNWFKLGKGEQDSTGTVIRNNKLGTQHGKKQLATPYTRKASAGQQNRVNPTL